MSLLNSESLHIFKIKEFRLFVLARFFLTLAIQMQFGTLYLQVYYEHSKDEFILGMVGLCEAFPFIVTSLFSGHFADSFAKKRIIVAAVSVLLLGALILYLNSSPHIALFSQFGLYALFGIVFLFGITRSFLAASTNPYMSQLVPRQYYTHSATWNSTAWHTGAILGPVLAGLIYGFHGKYNAAWCHLTEVCLFVLALFFLVRIQNHGKPELKTKKESVVESMKVGLRFVFKNKMVLSAISLDLFAVLFGGAVALIPAFTDKILHLGPEAYGLLRTAPAIGAVALETICRQQAAGRRIGSHLRQRGSGSGRRKHQAGNQSMNHGSLLELV